MSIKEILQQDPKNQEIEINGWVRTFRSNRFISLSDGSTINNLQAVVDFENTSEPVYTKPIAPTPKPQPAPVVKEKPKTKPKKVEPKSDDQQTSMF